MWIEIVVRAELCGLEGNWIILGVFQWIFCKKDLKVPIYPSKCIAKLVLARDSMRECAGA